MKRKEVNFVNGAKFLCMLTAGLFLLSACGNTKQKDTNDVAAPMEVNTIASDFEYRHIAESENGYYFWERMNADQYDTRLMFMDKESGRVVPLCNRPDCGHEGRECNAYFSGLNIGADGIDKQYLQYYEGSLYAVGLSADDYVVLFRIKADGSEWEIVTKLYRTDYAATGHWHSPELLIEEGYVYFVDWKQKIKKLERIPIGGGASEVVFEGDSDALEVQIFRMKSNEGFLYFQVLNFSDNIYENAVGGLYCCNTETGQCSLVKEGLSGPYSVCNGFVYYGNQEGLCRYSVQDQTAEILVGQTMNVPNITLTKDYIILCDQMADYGLTLYDYDGMKITTVSNTLGLHWYFGGNAERLFGECAGERGLSLCFLDLTRPVTELQWEELKEN